MIKGSNCTIQWAELKAQVDPNNYQNLPNNAYQANGYPNQYGYQANGYGNYYGYQANPQQAQVGYSAYDPQNEQQRSTLERISTAFPIRSQAEKDRIDEEMKQYFLAEANKGDMVNRLHNVAHTAYRYLFLNPNPMIDPNSGFAVHDRYNGRAVAANIDPEHRDLIRSIWLALKDEKFAISDAYSREDAKLELIKQLATLGRVHNWDHSRTVWKNIKGRQVQVQEDYDDGRLDNPSCNTGVPRRLTQFAMLVLKEDPNERVLNSNLMREKFREEMLAETAGKNTVFNVIARMDLQTANKLKDALDDLVAVNVGDFSAVEKEDQALLRQIQCYTTQDLQNFITQCKTYYGDKRICQKLVDKLRYHEKSFDNYGQLALYFAEDVWSVYYDQIKESINKRISELDPSAPKPVAKLDEQNLPAVVMSAEEIQRLREQLTMFSLQTNNQGLMNATLAADANELNRLAAQYRNELARAAEAAQQAEQARLQQAAAAAEREAQRRLQEEAARRQAEENRLAQEALRQEQAIQQAQQAEEALRQQALNHAFATNNEVLAAQMMDADIAEVTAVLEAIRLQTAEAERREREEAARQEAARQEAVRQEAARLEVARKEEEARQEGERLAGVLRQALLRQQAQIAQQTPQQVVQPSPLLAAYTASRQKPVQPAALQIKAELAALFTSDVAKQMLAVLNIEERVVYAFNQLNPQVTQLFVNGIKPETLETFKKMNGATQVGFLTKFAASKNQVSFWPQTKKMPLQP
ncbi:MAG: hypothetical protein AB7I18_05525 [Candidatus Berkiella sp.]